MLKPILLNFELGDRAQYSENSFEIKKNNNNNTEMSGSISY